MQVGSDGVLQLESFADQVSDARSTSQRDGAPRPSEEAGVDSQLLQPSEVQSVEGEAGFAGKPGTDALLCRRVAELEERITELTATNADKARQQLSTEAKFVLAKGEQFMESLRLLLQEPSVTCPSQELVFAAETSVSTVVPHPAGVQPSEARPGELSVGVSATVQRQDSGAPAVLHDSGRDDGEWAVVQDESATPTGTARQEKSLPAGQHSIKDATEMDQDLGVSAALRLEELDSDESALVRRVVKRLVEERQGSKAGRPFGSILNRMAGMSHCELELLVDIYNAPDSKLSSGSEAAAAEPSDLQRATEATQLPVSGSTAESGLHPESVVLVGDTPEPELRT